MMPQHQVLRYKVFLIGGHNDFLRTAMGRIRLFEDRGEAQAAAVAGGGGFVLGEDEPAPSGFDRSLF